MATDATEKRFEADIESFFLSPARGYTKGADTYDAKQGLYVNTLIDFVQHTQTKERARFENANQVDPVRKFCTAFNTACETEGLLSVLRHGFKHRGLRFRVCYFKPESALNQAAAAQWAANTIECYRQWYFSADTKKSVDMVLVLNGIPVFAFELKNQYTGQTVDDAKRQWMYDRDPRELCFQFNKRILAYFCVDHTEVWMTTKLAGKNTYFLPFNQGSNGAGNDGGKGNPANPNGYPTAYLWENVFQKDSMMDIVQKFLNLKDGKTLIFPRYHQLDVVRKLLADVRQNGAGHNYLIQHSAGSGKSNSIAWTAYRLASLFNEENKPVFSSVVVVTDRTVLDAQLQETISGFDHTLGAIETIGEDKTSKDLRDAINGGVRIIVTTLQKFPVIYQEVDKVAGRNFAIIVDEAHSSQTGSSALKLKAALADTEDALREYAEIEGKAEEELDPEDRLMREMTVQGRHKNLSFFAFTATPKDKTLELFGTEYEDGSFHPFHIYSMRQAIEEGFILDVLQNYTTYDTFYQLNKEIEEDPRCKTADAKRQIARFVELHETNIAQRVEVIIEHFRTTVMPELGGMAKAMVITASRQGAVKYRQAFENYTKKKGYTDIKALVAFSGKVKLPDDETEYSEASMNGFPEDRLTKEFDKDEYQVLLVANKYQTGFDQPKLCAMYVLKKLKGVSAVQTLSRLNRICPPFEKKTFVLDFANTYEDIKAAFAPYYTTTLLSTSVTPTAIYDLEAQIDAYTVLDPDDIEKANELLYKKNISAKDKQKLTFYFKRAKNMIEQYDLVRQQEIVSAMRHFVRFYEFLLQASCFEDTDLHKKYNFITYLLAYINIKHPGGGYNLDGKIKATNFVQKKVEEHTTSNLVAQPVVKLPTAENFGLTEAKEERLSEIIAEINSRTGKAYNNDVAVKAMLQIRDILLKSDKLKTSARNNTVKDFEFSYFDDIDDALIEGLEQNQDFFSLLLSNEEIKRQVLGIFTEEIYKSLREA